MKQSSEPGAGRRYTRISCVSKKIQICASRFEITSKGLVCCASLIGQRQQPSGHDLEHRGSIKQNHTQTVPSTQQDIGDCRRLVAMLSSFVPVRACPACILRPSKTTRASRKRSRAAFADQYAQPADNSGSPDVQEKLMDIIRVQIGQEKVKDFVKEEGEKLRQAAEEVSRCWLWQESMSVWSMILPEQY